MARRGDRTREAAPPVPLPNATPAVAAAGVAVDPLIHERVRLGIMSALAAVEMLPFTELRRLLGLTDGNLGVHARKLEDAGYVQCTKRFEGRVPQTVYALTADGRAAFDAYLTHMEALIHRARAGAR